MSLLAAIQIARSAMATSQIGLQVAGQNMANFATPGYTRQIAMLQGIPGASSDIFMIGRGVTVSAVRRQIDTALQQRLWQSTSDEHAAAQKMGIMDQLEGLLNELTGFDLSTEFSEFYNAWSELGNLSGSETVVINQGEKLASFIRSLRSDMEDLRKQIETQIDQQVNRADVLLTEIGALNTAITNSEIGQSEANGLRDQRDQLVTELSTLMDVTVVEDQQGNFDILVGSTPVVLGGSSRGIEIIRTTESGVQRVEIAVKADGSPLPITSGSIGGLLDSRNATIDKTIVALDKIAGQLIFEVNKIHSTGVNAEWQTSAFGTLELSPTDRALAFNDPNNTTLAGLPFGPSNGSFEIRVKNSATGATEIIRIDVDLDGLNALGEQGFGNDTSPEDIRAALDAIDGINASFDSSGKLKIEGDAGYDFTFSDDTSGVLATLGVNSFFEGTNASTMGVRQSMLDDPTQLLVGRLDDTGAFIENGNALAMVDLQSLELEIFGGRTISEAWADRVQTVAVEAATTQTVSMATRLVRASLEGQRASLSGVSIDEESINLLNFQRQFQGAARIITVADEMLQTLIALV